MNGRRKRFSKELYAIYDQKAKDYATAELEKLGYEVRNHRLKRSVDLVVSKDGEDLFFVECEIKTALDEEFKYDDLQLPERKSKFIGMELPTLFMLFSSTGDRYFCVWGRFVEKSPLEEVSNRHIRSGEFFYKIPLTNCDTKLADALKR